MKRFLITTALEETWSETNEPVLFLGEWCRRRSRIGRWSKMDADVLSYHWDDRAKLHADYRYLQEFYRVLLQDLTVQLNQIHCVDHGLRYWQILVGPWLGYFVQILFDRWTCVQEAIRRHELSETIILTGQEDTLVPRNMEDFRRLHVDDEWNHHIYATLLRESLRVSCTYRVWEPTDTLPKPEYEISWKRHLKKSLAECYSSCAALFTRDTDAFLLNTYLPFHEEMRTHRRLGQIPQLWRSVPPVQVPVQWTQRNWIVAGGSRSEFEVFVRALVPRHLPTAYLEGYAQLVEQTAALAWPKRPKLIWTSASHNHDDVFKAWTASKVEHGSPLVIGQHGGHYGTGRWSFNEEHETDVSDCYLSWGWSEPCIPKVRPVGQFTSKRPLEVRHSKQPDALLVTCSLPRFSYWMYSVVVSRQYLDYFDDQCAFVASLPEAIRDRLVVRLFPIDFGWDQAMRWRDRFPNLRLEDGRSSLNDLVRQSRIYVSTYNATTFLESFTMNVPTVMYWNAHHWELRDSALPYFEALKRVGVFHATPESAAKHVADIWNDVDAWWTSLEVQEAVDGFKERYCSRPADLLDRLVHVLQEVATVTDGTATQ